MSEPKSKSTSGFTTKTATALMFITMLIGFGLGFQIAELSRPSEPPPPPVQPQYPVTGIFSGQALDALSNQPIPDATITLYDSLTLLWVGKTNQSGYFATGLNVTVTDPIWRLEHSSYYQPTFVNQNEFYVTLKAFKKSTNWQFRVYSFNGSALREILSSDIIPVHVDQLLSNSMQTSLEVLISNEDVYTALGGVENFGRLQIIVDDGPYFKLYDSFGERKDSLTLQPLYNTHLPYGYINRQWLPLKLRYAGPLTATLVPVTIFLQEQETVGMPPRTLIVISFTIEIIP